MSVKGIKTDPKMEFDERPRRPHTNFDISYITSTSGAPILGITSPEGYDNMLAKMRLHDPDFEVSSIGFNGKQTHQNRMKQMNRAITYMTSLMRGHREWSVADYTYTAVKAASSSWPDGIPTVMFACRPGDRARYPVFKEIDEIRVRLDRDKRMRLNCLLGIEVDGKKFEQLQEDRKKLGIALKTLEQDGEMIAALTLD